MSAGQRSDYINCVCHITAAETIQFLTIKGEARARKIRNKKPKSHVPHFPTAGGIMIYTFVYCFAPQQCYATDSVAAHVFAAATATAIVIIKILKMYANPILTGVTAIKCHLAGS